MVDRYVEIFWSFHPPWFENWYSHSTAFKREPVAGKQKIVWGYKEFSVQPMALVPRKCITVWFAKSRHRNHKTGIHQSLHYALAHSILSQMLSKWKKKNKASFSTSIYRKYSQNIYDPYKFLSSPRNMYMCIWKRTQKQVTLNRFIS